MRVVGKADIAVRSFDLKQSRESVDQPLTCNPSPRLKSCALRGQFRRKIIFLLFVFMQLYIEQLLYRIKF